MANTSKFRLLIACVSFMLGFTQPIFSANNPSSLAIFQEGTDFIELPEQSQNNGAPDLALVFWYGSESSFQVLSALSQGAYADSVTLWPAVFRERWRHAGKLALKANKLGFTTAQHLNLMESVITQKPDWRQPDTEYSLLSSLITTESNEQPNQEALELVLRDLTIAKELKNVQNLINSYPISSVPTIIFKGQFVITAEQAKTSRRLLQILDFLNKRQYQLTHETSGDQQQ